MTLADASPLIGAAMQLVGQIIAAIQQSVHMSEEQKQEALRQLQFDLDNTVQKVKGVRFDAVAKGNQAP